MHDPSLLSVMLLLLFAESLFFGAFCVLYIFSLWVLVYRQRRHRRSAQSFCMTAIVTIMFLLSGLYLALDIRLLMIAYVEHGGTPNGPSDFLYHPVNDPSRNVHPVILAVMTFIGDGFMTYRIYVVWKRQLVSLVVPALLLVGDLVAAAFTAKRLLHGSRAYYSILTPSASPELIAYFSMTLLTNIVTTLLLLGRLWWHDNSVKKYRTPGASTSVHWQVMKTIIQSEVAYSVGVILNLAAYVAHSNLAILTSAIIPPLLGISFTLIITRIGISEMLGEASDTHPTLETQAVQLNERGRPFPPIAVNVFIARTDDSQDTDAPHDKTGPADDESLVEGAQAHTRGSFV
ncbi:uncharacterized protein TRAVEDRAFT_53242 [Trametes versicolor FP-101664 SS1]|uniref:uncharacterized protein n=1 Tax=Trametes versicolor (strain FP-101664) TaxID=717944 RepID=UPI000462270D|nr:uncharacterized protein TRAVEDRAFT_53242 [Trametes versicolor FP-101664 SS1]EIW52803.1 hypothetical protein TRAVEDRAFT_53242 [Trametes versicolor FP-101664 SS1]